MALAADLDGTLTTVDTLHEALLKLIRAHPLDAFRLPFWLAAGKAGFKRIVAERASVDPALLPFDDQVIGMVRQARADGCVTVLATASDRRVAEAVAKHLGLFDEVMASEDGVNLSGARKRDALVSRFGAHGFDYIGNSSVDRPVWALSRKAILHNVSDRLVDAVRREHRDVEVVGPRTANTLEAVKPLVEACRIYQWVKNILVFVPLFASHNVALPNFMIASWLFVVFGLAASAGYLINDLLDIEADRQHPRKRFRPFASGRARVADGVALAAVLAITSLVLSAFISWYVLLMISVYTIFTNLYSTWLKKIAMMDVILLSGLYTFRILTGGIALGIPISLWMLGFSMYLFFSLALAKRYCEIAEVEGSRRAKLAGRGYRGGDAALLMALGTSSGMAAVLTLALYANSAASQGLYGQPEYLWSLCPILLYWIARIWLAAQRRVLTDDPIVFAFRDRVSLMLFALALVPVAMAIPK